MSDQHSKAAESYSDHPERRADFVAGWHSAVRHMTAARLQTDPQNTPLSRYRKKPVVIQAQQLTEESGERLAQWCGGTWHPTIKPGYSSAMRIPTLEGVMTARLGDWIIRGIRGEFYSCKPDIFEATYEPAPHLVMVCGVDCHPGDSICNNYCNEAPQKGPMVDAPPPGPDAK